MSKSFAELGISDSLVTGIGKDEISSPTAIQAAVIPLMLQGKDVIGQSPTGTGKTLAYVLPLVQKIEAEKRETQAIILAPTHELAMQVYHQIGKVTQNAGMAVTAAPIIGQVNINRQIELLKDKPHILVGSSGRILELIQKRKINAQKIRVMIIDEADRLLDETNWESVKAIAKTTLRDRQTVLFSATMTPAAIERAKQLLQEPEIVSVTGQNHVPPAIAHLFFLAEQRDKLEVLRKLVTHLQVEQALVFLNQPDAVETTVAKLNYHGLTAAAIYGTTSKADRQKALEGFRTGKIRLLIASDLAARGLDIQGLQVVVNLDLPEDPQLYLHRVGRTGRAGKPGNAISIINPREAGFVPKIEKTLKIHMEAKQLLRGRIVDAKPIRSQPVRN